MREMLFEPLCYADTAPVIAVGKKLRRSVQLAQLVQVPTPNPCPSFPDFFDLPIWRVCVGLGSGALQPPIAAVNGMEGYRDP